LAEPKRWRIRRKLGIFREKGAWRRDTAGSGRLNAGIRRREAAPGGAGTSGFEIAKIRRARPGCTRARRWLKEEEEGKEGK